MSIGHSPWGLSIVRLIVAISSLSLFSLSKVLGEVASPAEMEQVCQNWLTQQVSSTGSWAGEQNPQIIGVNDIHAGDTLVARWYDISPRGFVLVPVLKEMSPVKLYSDETNLDERQEGGIIAMVREQFSTLYRQYSEKFGSLDAPQPSTGDAVFGRSHRADWDAFTVSKQEFAAGMSAKRMPFTSVGPLTSTLWHQGAPYNNLCPMGDGGRTVVGCVATAAAQILRYWQWPEQGTGSHTYTWAGDYSCEGSTPGADQTADFSDSYDWANMPISCDGCSPAEEAALAELCYEVGVAFDMDYGACGSGAYTMQARRIFTSYFKFSPDARAEYREYYDLAGWFALIQQEINANRVIMYRISRHAIVCDGWRDDNGKPEFHMNYGWSGTATAWYVLDSLYCYWEPGDLCPASVEGMTIQLHPRNAPMIEEVSSTAVEFAGDGDGHAEAGETVDLNVTIGNEGIDAFGVSATLVSTDPHVTIISGSSNYADIVWQGTVTSITPYRVQFAPGCPDPHVALVELNVTAAGGYSATDTILLFAGNTTGMSEDVEGGSPYWTHRSPNGAYADQWHIETNRSHGGANSWKMGGAEAAFYSNLADARLITPPFLLPTASALTYWQWIGAEIQDDTIAWDGGVVMISADGGTWTQLTPIGGYPYKIIEGTQSNLLELTPCFSDDKEWKKVTFDLSSYSGVVQLMFRFATDPGVTEEGWYVDDISVAPPPCCIGGVGNVDCDPLDVVDVSDLTTLIDNLFINFTPLCCEGEANCDGAGGVDVSDLTTLIDNLFINFTSLPACQ